MLSRAPRLRWRFARPYDFEPGKVTPGSALPGAAKGDRMHAGDGNDEVTGGTGQDMSNCEFVTRV